MVTSISTDLVVDSHVVDTSDGFILKVFRIRGTGPKYVSRLGEGKPKPVVFL